MFNLASWMVPWELRIKEIESLFGSAVASYFTFLRWVFSINLVLAIGYAVFVVIPEVCLTSHLYLTLSFNPQVQFNKVLGSDWDLSGERKGLLAEEQRTATDLQTLWDFEGVLKYSPIFYGFYSNQQTKEGYKLPFAYFFTGIVLYMYSFIIILRKYDCIQRLYSLFK